MDREGVEESVTALTERTPENWISKRLNWWDCVRRLQADKGLEVAQTDSGVRAVEAKISLRGWIRLTCHWPRLVLPDEVLKTTGRPAMPSTIRSFFTVSCAAVESIITLWKGDSNTRQGGWRGRLERSSFAWTNDGGGE